MPEVHDIGEWHGRSVLALLLGVLALLLGVGPASGYHGAGPVGQLRPAALVASVFTRPSAAPPSRAVASAADSWPATRSARGAGQAKAAASRQYRAAAPVQDPGAEPDPAAPARPRWLGSQLLPRLPSAASRLPGGLPSGRAPPRPAGT